MNQPFVFERGKLTFMKQNLGVNPKIGGKPPKWMVKIMENHIKMDDLGGKPPIFGSRPMCFLSKALMLPKPLHR